MKLLIDIDFKSILPPLTTTEYMELEKSIKEKGVLSPILVWNGYIVDGHNRYEICTTNRIDNFPIKEVEFNNKEEVLEWILSHQLGRRNLTDFQRNEVALKYEQIISKRMRERMSERGREQADFLNNSKVRPNGHTLENTSARKELAKIANTSEGSIQRTKYILENGTEEQIERARKGGSGNSIGTIEREIKESTLTQKKCTKCGKEKSISDFDANRNVCKSCRYEQKKMSDGVRFFGKKTDIPESLRRITEEEIVGDLYDTEKVIEYNDDDLEQELNCMIDKFYASAENCLNIHNELLKNEESKDKVLRNLTLLQSKLQNLKERYSYEK